MATIPSTQGNPQASDVAVESALPMVGSSVREDLQTTLGLADAQVSKLFEDRNITLADGGDITFPVVGTSVSFTQSLKLHINSKVAGGSPTVIDLGATTRALSANLRMIYAVVNRTAGTATVTADATSLPAVTSSNQEIVLIAKRIDSGDGTKTLYFRDGSAMVASATASRLGSTGGSGGGVALSAITAAITSNDINNGANAQQWRWNSLGVSNGLTLSSTDTSLSGKVLLVDASGAGNSAQTVRIQNAGTGNPQGLNISMSGATGANSCISANSSTNASNATNLDLGLTNSAAQGTNARFNHNGITGNNLELFTNGNGVRTQLRLYNHGATGPFTNGANNNGSSILFSNNDNASINRNIANIDGIITDVSTGAFKGALVFKTANNGATAEIMRVDTTSLNMNSHKITNVTDPTTAQDAATKAYVDATSSNVATLTNKTFGDAITFTQITTPTTPSSGFDKLYFKSDDKLYKKTSAGVESEVGAAGLTNPMNNLGQMIKSTSGGAPVVQSAPSGSTRDVNFYGMVLSWNSTGPNFIDWHTQLGFKNLLVNSAFDFWQAGTSQTIGNGSSTYGPDQWYGKNVLGTNGVLTLSRYTGEVDGSRYGAKLQITTAPTASQANGCEIYQVLANDVSVNYLYNSRASFSINARGLGNVTGLGLQFYYSTTESKVTTAIGSEVTFPVNTNTGIFTRGTLEGISNTAIGTSMTTSGVIGVRIRIASVSGGNTYDLNNGFQIEQAMLNVGQYAQQYQRQNASSAAEFHACQYFYEKSYEVTADPGSNTSNSAVAVPAHATDVTGDNFYFNTKFAVAKRANPSISLWDTAGNSGKFSTANGGGALGTNVGSISAANSVATGFYTNWVTPTGNHFTTFYHWVADSRI